MVSGKCNDFGEINATAYIINPHLRLRPVMKMHAFVEEIAPGQYHSFGGACSGIDALPLLTL